MSHFAFLELKSALNIEWFLEMRAAWKSKQDAPQILGSYLLRPGWSLGHIQVQRQTGFPPDVWMSYFIHQDSILP